MENNKDKAIFLIGRDGIHSGAVNKQGLTALDLCDSKWKQGLTFVLLVIQGASKGRLPKNEDVPIGGGDLKPFINTMTLVATLLATITFAAAFTMPGGFDTNPDNLGVAILIKKASLKAFILADTIGMCCSMAVMFLVMWAMIADDDTVEELVNVSSKLLPFALFATLVAFVCAIFAVIAPKALWVTILVGIICSGLIASSSPIHLVLATLFLWIFQASAVLIRRYAEARTKGEKRK
ncbi:hypothetical protein Vadar_031909 [Vaccinium darrowii]|uniref:Uncharacterized protein n=1 Tax=Vaccinium darrowii TaxID=229202 RepID=A0ACB7XW97_9ERIC|nr:hypothetical protein Vadar_031909 [Vaccinium darrowii]